MLARHVECVVTGGNPWGVDAPTRPECLCQGRPPLERRRTVSELLVCPPHSVPAGRRDAARVPAYPCHPCQGVHGLPAVVQPWRRAHVLEEKVQSLPLLVRQPAQRISQSHARHEQLCARVCKPRRVAVRLGERLARGSAPKQMDAAQRLQPFLPDFLRVPPQMEDVRDRRPRHTPRVPRHAVLGRSHEQQTADGVQVDTEVSPDGDVLRSQPQHEGSLPAVRVHDAHCVGVVQVRQRRLRGPAHPRLAPRVEQRQHLWAARAPVGRGGRG